MNYDQEMLARWEEIDQALKYEDWGREKDYYTVIEWKDEVSLPVEMNGKIYKVFLRKENHGDLYIYNDDDGNSLSVSVYKAEDLSTGKIYDESTDEGWNLTEKLGKYVPDDETIKDLFFSSDYREYYEGD